MMTEWEMGCEGWVVERTCTHATAAKVCSQPQTRFARGAVVGGDVWQRQL